jgi:hypothetical protein
VRPRDLALRQLAVEHAGQGQREELVRTASELGIEQVVVELGRAYAQHRPGAGVVADGAVVGAREQVRELALLAVGEADADRLGGALQHQVCIGAVAVPPIRHTVVSPALAVHQQARLEPSPIVGARFVEREIKVFDEDAPLGEGPAARLGEADGRRVGHGEPAPLAGAVAPERCDDVVGQEPRARLELRARGVDEYARLAEMQGSVGEALGAIEAKDF